MDAPIQSHKLIITGTGRAGTTFLVRLLTELGLDTGYTRRSWRKDYSAHCNAGLEHDLDSPQAPYIVKNPSLCETLPGFLASGRFVIDHALIPVRELEAASLSRARIGGKFSSVPGGLLHTAAPADQKAVLAELFHQLIHTLVAHDIPHTFLLFPRIVEDPDYAHARLRFLLAGTTPDEFRAAFARVADPRLVHKFPARPPAAAPVRETAPARAYFRRQRRIRFLRRARRVSLRFGIAMMMGLVFVGWRSLEERPSVAAAAVAPVVCGDLPSMPVSSSASSDRQDRDTLAASGEPDGQFTPWLPEDSLAGGLLRPTQRRTPFFFP